MLTPQDTKSLKTLLPKGQVFTDRASLISYEVDSGMDRGIPEAIVFPHSTADVVSIVRWAAQHAIPLIARGAGTGLSGGAVADRGGIIVEFSRMNAILELDMYGRIAIVEPAVINLALAERAKTKGLYFPPDPASQRASTIGGNVSENSGGPHCFKYGVTTNYVTGLDVVLADSRNVRVGGRALDYPAYDLCGLITGSEGMLGLMTAITVRLLRNPPAVKTMLVVFDTVEQAGTAVSAIIATGLVPAAMEMMDQKIVQIIEDFAHAGLPTDAGAVLIIEVDGYPDNLDFQIEEIAHILQEHGGRNLRIASSVEERDAIWFARKSAAGAITRLAPAYYTVDITVPRSLLAETLAEVNQICERYGLRAGHVFHAGDGNLHPLILIPDPEDQHLMERVHRAGWEMVELCVRKGGSLSGEHGVGIEKRDYMPLMHNPAELAAMWDIKQVFDPHNLLNPGKLFPTEAGGARRDPIYRVPRAGRWGQSNENDPAPSVGVKDEGRRPADAPTHLRDGANPPAVSRGTLSVVGGQGEPRGQGISWPAPWGADAGSNTIFTPTTAEEAAHTLTTLSATDQPTYITGSPQPILRNAVQLSTTALKGIKTYAPDDLYITVGSGTPLTEIQTFLAADRKQVPLATPWPHATIGGLIAANVNAPLRMRYGSMRDLVLCTTVALADGRVIRAGRSVIKNVAGYDLNKVFIGSHGTLGLITDVTLKIVVQPRTQRTLLIPLDDLRYGLIWARKIMPIALIASAIVLCKDCNLPGMAPSPYVLAYTAEGMPEDVQAELDQIRQVLRAADNPDLIEVESPSGTDIWAEFLGNAIGKLLVRVGVPPQDVASYINDQAATLNTGTFLADIGSGLVYAVTAMADVARAQAWVEQLRQPALKIGGYAVVMDMPEGWQDKIDRWGYRPETLDVMRRLKARWDPKGILNAGRFIVDEG